MQYCPRESDTASQPGVHRRGENSELGLRIYKWVARREAVD